LHFVNRMDLLFALQFHNQSILYDKVGAEPAIQLHPLVDKRHCFLSDDP